MKKTLTNLLFIPLLVLITACSSSAATPVYVPEGTERDAIITNTDAILQDLLSGIENKDSELFSQNFSEEMLDAMKPSDQEKLFDQFEVLGKSQSFDLVNVQELQDNFAVRYKVTYQEKVLIYRIVVSRADTKIQTGLWFE